MQSASEAPNKNPLEILRHISQDVKESGLQEHQRYLCQNDGTVVVSKSESGEFQAEVVTGMWHSFRAMVVSWFRSIITDSGWQHYSGKDAETELSNRLLNQIAGYAKYLERIADEDLQFEASDLGREAGPLAEEIEKLHQLYINTNILGSGLDNTAIDSFKSASENVFSRYDAQNKTRLDQIASDEIRQGLASLPQETDASYTQKGIELIERYETLSEKHEIEERVASDIKSLRTALQQMALNGEKIESGADEELIGELKQANMIHGFQEKVKAALALTHGRHAVKGKELELIKAVNDLRADFDLQKEDLSENYFDEVSALKREIGDLYTIALYGLDSVGEEISNLEFTRNPGESIAAYEDRISKERAYLSSLRASLNEVNDEQTREKRSEIIALIDQKDQAIRNAIITEREMISLIQDFASFFGDIDVAVNPEEAFRLISKKIKSKVKKKPQEESGAYLMRLSHKHESLSKIQWQLTELIEKLDENGAERKEYYKNLLQNLSSDTKIKQKGLNRKFSEEVEIMLSKQKFALKASQKNLKSKMQKKDVIYKNLHRTIVGVANGLAGCSLPDPSLRDTFPVLHELELKLRDYYIDDLIAAPKGSRIESRSAKENQEYQYGVQNWILSDEFRLALPGLMNYIRDVKLVEAKALQERNLMFKEQTDRAIETVKGHYPKYRDFHPAHSDTTEEIQDELREFAKEVGVSYTGGGTQANVALIGPDAVERLGNIPGLFGIGKKYSEEEVKGKLRLVAHQLQLLDAAESESRLKESEGEVASWERHLEVLQSLERFATSSGESVRTERDQLAALEGEIQTLNDEIEAIKAESLRIRYLTIKGD